MAKFIMNKSGLLKTQSLSMDITKFEVSYSPNNLRQLLKQLSMTQLDCANCLGVGLRIVQRWCAPVGAKNHSDMPLEKWLELFNSLEFGGVKTTEGH